MPMIPREIGFILFRILIPLLLFGLQYLLYSRFRAWLKRKVPTNTWAPWLAAGIFLAMNIALLYVTLFRPRPSEYTNLIFTVGAYPFFIWHGATFFIGFVLLISLIAKAPLRILVGILNRFSRTRTTLTTFQAKPAYQSFDASRRTFIRRGMYGVTAASFGASAYGMLVEKKSHEVTEAEFRLKNLPLQLHGFTIALMSDIHSSLNMTKPEMDTYVKITNSLQCDLILVTGDFVNSATEEVYPFAEAFSELHAPKGVFGVMGNHDFFAPQPEIVAKEVDGCGVKLLRNDKVLIDKNGGSFYLIGVDDVGRPETASAKLRTAIGHAPLSIPRILMIHRPYFLQQAATQNIDLALSGHTHGGQVVLAQLGDIRIAPASLVSRYVWGKYRIGNTQMYVNRGIGTVGLPIRLNCPPEITKITLLPATPSS
jgi:uncharacterized protein